MNKELRSSFNHSYLSYENGAYSFRRRNPRFSWEELQILAQETSKNFELLRQKETDDAVKQMKQRVWTVITEKVNAVNRSNSRREPLQLKRKWIEARSRVRHKLIASHRRRIGSQESNTSAAPSSSSNGTSGADSLAAGDTQRPSAAATPVELSYFEKLLTLSMSEELQDEEMKIASQHRQLRQQQLETPPTHRQLPSHIPVHQNRQRAAKAASRGVEEEEALAEDGEEDGEDVDYEDGPSCLTMTPEEMSQESQQADVEMWGNHDDEELDLLSGGLGARRRRGLGSRFDGMPKLKEDVAEEIFGEESGGCTPVPDALPTPQSRPCALCGSGPTPAFDRMLAERHALKLNILHNKSHYWYAKCRQVAPEAAVAPPIVSAVAALPSPRPTAQARFRPGGEVKPELFDVHMAH